MDNIMIRNIKKKDIPKVVDIQIDGWKTAYRGIIEDNYLDSLNRRQILSRSMFFI